MESTPSSSNDVLEMVEFKKKKNRSLCVPPTLFFREEMSDFNSTI